MIPIFQCGRFKYDLKLELSETEYYEWLFVFVEFPKGIPNYVEEATDDCPKFKERK